MADANKELIEKTRLRRERFLDDLEKDPQLMTDPKVGALFLKGLSDSDKQAQTNLRLEVEDKAADNAASQAQALVAISESIKTNSENAGVRNPFKKEKEAVELGAPVVKESGKFDIKDTELNETASAQNYDQFTEKRKAEEKQKLSKK